MRLFETVADLTGAFDGARRPLGLVPTMGFLHQGHMALVSRARSECATVAVSIFVNPAQFGPQEDLDIYPRDLPGDLSGLKSSGVDLVFAPSVEEMYPEGFGTYVDVGPVGELLEGKSRPGHFRGVATVVCKLLALTRPDLAYFGQKDGQQSVIVKRLNADLNLGAEIVIVPTVREHDGLAVSSRNVFLGPDERKAAPVLHRALRLARDLKTTDAGELKRRMLEFIQNEPLARVDYVSVADPHTLEEISHVAGSALVSAAVRFGNVRLIDNITLGETEP